VLPRLVEIQRDPGSAISRVYPAGIPLVCSSPFPARDRRQSSSGAPSS